MSVAAARRRLDERLARDVATLRERLAVVALHELPDEGDEAAVRALGSVGGVHGVVEFLVDEDCEQQRRNRWWGGALMTLAGQAPPSRRRGETGRCDTGCRNLPHRLQAGTRLEDATPSRL